MVDYMCPANPTVTHCYHAAKVNELIAERDSEIKRLRAALEEIVAQDDAAACCGKGCGYGDQLECCGYPEYGIDRAQRIARAALTAQPAAPGGEA